MVTLLDCINRVPMITDQIILNREKTMASFFETIGSDLKNINQLVLVGSGTSNTAAVTARGFMEKTSGIQTICVLPNEFLNNCSVYNPHALFIYTSQSGTSILTQEAVERIKTLGYWTVGITESDDTQLAKMVHAHVDMGCGKEEYGMRTIGYCASILTLMLLGLEIGHKLGRVDEKTYLDYIEQAKNISKNHRTISDATMTWFDRNKEKLLSSSSFTLYGGNALYGVALEGALKILEISKRILAVGYESDDGMHGPTMGFTHNNCVIVLNDGGADSIRLTQLATWAKNEMHNGFVMGCDTIDDTDLSFEVTSGAFKAIEFAPAVEVLAYRLAVDMGIDLTDKSRHKEKQYFNTHGQIK